jgi:hypothetical protein
MSTIESLPPVWQEWNYLHLKGFSHDELAKLEVILKKKLDLVADELAENILVNDNHVYQMVRNYIARTQGRPYPKERLD